MSSTVRGLFLVSLATMRAALASDKGPWKVSRVRLGGSSASVICGEISPGARFPHLDFAG